ncbi:ATP-binding protein [Pedobacter frigoris]|uniref:PAS domain-containing sensor histidine kinase n=1 Tax=Pedobacter frigoris TaxID=2571272 RepID=UPI00292EAD18|nr:ATP-binding protein [Pedobacter frigoris]
MQTVDHPKNSYHQYLSGGGEMGELTRTFDWSSTVLGAPENWSQSLLTTVSIILNSRFPMFLWWGPELIQFYNDAYRPSLGNEGKHPMALGQRGEECWPEIWPVIKPLIDQVMAGGESTWSEDQLIPIYRNGKLENVYWTFSYSRVNNEYGKPGGVLVICNETTKQINSYHELELAKDELEFAITSAELGTWDLNPATGKFIGNERLKSWFGLPPDSEIELSRAIDVIAEQDRERVTNAIQAAIAVENGGSYDIEYTIINPLDPMPRHVRAKGKAMFNYKKEVFRFSGVMLDITEQKKDEMRKNDFIGMVSHELKTPLTSLTGYIQMLMIKTRKIDDDFMTPALVKMNAQIRRMTGLINGFLNISRLESGKIQINKQSFCLNELIRQIIEETEMTTSGYEINFECPNSLTLFADRDKIAAVISNLLSNAIKYSPKGRKVDIKCRQEDDKLHFSIRDEGMGIKPHDLQRLFDRFYRIETKHTENISGFGIGLYLSAEIIAHHKGRIWVESQSGVGSTFFFELPLA